MTPEEILEIAENPAIPSFVFGSEALKEWTREHRNQFTGECEKYSGYYVVMHLSTAPARLPSFRVLSCWNHGDRVPRYWDIDDTLPGLTSHELAVGMRQ